MSDKKWEAEKRKINRKLLSVMENKVTGLIDLAWFSEAGMWYDIDYLKELGLKIEIVYNTEFYITPKNNHVYLYWDGKFCKRDTLNVKTKTA